MDYKEIDALYLTGKDLEDRGLFHNELEEEMFKLVNKVLEDEVTLVPGGVTVIQPDYTSPESVRLMTAHLHNKVAAYMHRQLISFGIEKITIFIQDSKLTARVKMA